MTTDANFTPVAELPLRPLEPLSTPALQQLFLQGRTFNGWLDKAVTTAQLHQLVELTRMAPTSANCSPARIVFVQTDAAKQRLKPHLAEGNVKKTLSAPVVAILGNDMAFHEHLPKLFPHTDAKSWFEGDEEKIRETAERNGTLQGGYLIMAARALGLDCGPMSGFDMAGVDAEFFAGTKIKSNFLCNLGYGDVSTIFERSPRFTFDEMASII